MLQREGEIESIYSAPLSLRAEAASEAWRATKQSPNSPWGDCFVGTKRLLAMT